VNNRVQTSASEAAATCMLALPLLSLGAVEHVGLTMAAVAVAIAAFVVFRDGRGRSRLSRTSIMAGAALLLSGVYSMVQLAPLPRGLLTKLSPNAERVWHELDLALGASPAARPISVDPPGTQFAGATALIVACMFFVLAFIVTRVDGDAVVLRAVLIALSICAFIGVIQPAFGMTRVYGFFDLPGGAQSLGLSPLMNPNHAAAVGCVGPPIALAVALDAPTARGRWAAALGGMVCAVSVLLALSRGGIAVLSLELVAMGAYLAIRRRSGFLRRQWFGALGAASAVVVVAVLTVGGSRVLREARDTSSSKVALAKRALSAAREFWMVGAGRGSFAASFAAHEDNLAGDVGTIATHQAFGHSESWPGQLAFEHGFIVTAVFVLLLTVAVVWAIRRHGLGHRRYFALVALAGLVLHDLADFALEYAGAAGIAVALLAVVTGRAASSTVTRSLIWARTGAITAAVAIFALLAVSWRQTLEDEHGRVCEQLAHGRLEDLPDVTAALRRHPSDPYLAMLRGVQLINSPDGGKHLRRAILLGPGRPASHFWLARWFLRSGRRAQAFAEYRAARRLAPHLEDAIITDFVHADASLDEIIATATWPTTFDTAAMLLEERKRLVDAAALDEHQIATMPPALNARARQIRRALAAGRRDDVKRLVSAMIDAGPRAPLSHLVAASVADDPVSAERALERGLDACGDDVELLERLVVTRGVRLGIDAVGPELERFRAALALRQLSISRFHLTVADVHVARGEPEQAVRSLIEASYLNPEDRFLLERIARLAEATGQRLLAQQTWRRLSQAYPDQVEYRNALVRVSGSATVAPN
jgi:tetratricopeptide (TPR) repeat protein